MAKLEGVKTLDMVNGEITKVAYGGAEYERVGNVGEHGDIALRIAKPASFAEVGQFYPVVKEFEILRFIDDEGEKPSVHADRFVFFRKVAAPANPSVEERVAKAEGEIESLKSDVAALKGETEYKRIGKSEARAGDYVKYIDSDYLDICDYSFTIGKLYEIKAVDGDGDFEHEADNGERLMACPDDEELEFYRKVSDAAESKPERLKVGDYAKVVKRIRDHSAEIGEIVIVEMDDKSVLPYKCDKLNGERVGWFYADELVRATDEEVSEAKRAAKWAEIGREVGEYKVGDVVAYSDSYWFGNSGIGEVVDCVVEGRPKVWAVDYRGLKASYPIKHAKLTLVTPVEARFDR